MLILPKLLLVTSYNSFPLRRYYRSTEPSRTSAACLPSMQLPLNCLK